ncbi:MAG: NAD(P)H-dependent glycerol-3-phosphate dehydrogenase [Pseudomonadota bacterium]
MIDSHAGKVAVIGAGSWGTALALQFSRSGREVRLWARNAEQCETMQRDRVNDRYLPGARFPDSLIASNDLRYTVEEPRDVLIAVPSHALRETLTAVKPFLRAGDRISWASKGFELSTGKLPHEVASEVVEADRRQAVLSGPTFAKEVGDGLPTAMTVASEDSDYALEMAKALTCDGFRAYTSDDIIGVEVGGAVKNVLAIGAGMSDGLGYGANTRIALITRGLSEMTRLGIALGAHASTFMGLAGMGDLVLTCTDDLSRNRRMGLALAAGKTREEAQEEIQQVVEGVKAAVAVRDVAKAHNIEMPICNEIYRILHENVSPKEAVAALLSRDIGPEIEL